MRAIQFLESIFMSRSFILFLFFVSTALIQPTLARADHPAISLASNNSGAIITSSAFTMEKNSIALGWTNEFVKSDSMSDAALVDLATNHIHAHSADYMLTSVVNAAYGVTDNLTLSVRIPYIYRNSIRAGNHSHSGGVTTNTAVDHGNNSGVGDVTVMGKYRFVKAPFQSAVLFGLEIPTGETQAKSHGERLETEHQAGSGSWDPIFGFAVSDSWNGFSFDASLLYSWGTRGSQETDLGDRASYGIAVSHRIGGEGHDHGHGDIHQHRAFDVVLELNGEWYGTQQARDRGDQNSGGTQWFLSPGLRYTAGGGDWSGQLSVGLPIRDDLRRGHAATDYKITAGISKSF
jgi:hypothetical protein